MSTSGTERQFFPFLGNGIAQSLGQIPLLADTLIALTPGGGDGGRHAARRRTHAAYRAPSAFGVLAPPAVASGPTDVAMLAVVPPSARRAGRGRANWGPAVFAPIFTAFSKGPTDVAALVVAPSTARGRAKTAHRAPFYSAPTFFTVNTGPANVADLTSYPNRVHGRRTSRNQLPTLFAPAAPFVGGTPPGPVLSGLEPENGTVVQTLKYWTDVQRARDGSERRASLLTKPREVLNQSIVMVDDAVGTLRSTLFGAPLTKTYLPIYFEAVPSKNIVNSNVVTVDSTYADWIYTGTKILLLNFNYQYFTANVVNITGSGAATVLQLDATPPVAHDTYGIGSRVAPLYPVTPKDGQGLPRWLVNIGRWDATFDVAEPITSYGTGATINSYDGLQVIDIRPRVEGDAGGDVVSQDTFNSVMTALDTRNAYANRSPLARPRITRQHTWFIHTPADRQYWKKFIHTSLGMQKMFLLPTWRDDLVIQAQPAALDTVLQIKSTPDYVNNYFPSLAHRRLQLEHADGTVEYCKVVSATDGGLGIQYLTLSAGVSGTAISRISLLEQVRFDNSNDEYHFEWSQNMVGRIVLSFTTVNQ